MLLLLLAHICFQARIVVVLSNNNCAQDYGQCGGKQYTGAVCCKSAQFCCVRDDEWWSSCKPRSDNQCSQPEVAVVLTTTTKTTTKSVSTSSTAQASSTNLVTLECRDDHQQCGGVGWTGASCCKRRDSCCSTQNEFYSSCLPEWDPGAVCPTTTSTTSTSITATLTGNSSLSTTSVVTTATTTVPLVLELISNPFWVAAMDRYPPTNLSDACSTPSQYSSCQLDQIISRNCDKVAHAAYDVMIASTSGAEKRLPEQLWLRRGVRSLVACQRALSIQALVNVTGCESQSDLLTEAASLAANAWGAGMMDETQCCTLLHAPFCVTVSTGTTWAIFGILGISLLVIVISSFLVAFQNSGSPEASSAVDATRSVPQPKSSAELSSRVAGSSKPSVASTFSWSHSDIGDGDPYISGTHAALEQAWLRRSCLRVLPRAEEFANASASLFTWLYETFDFQIGNVHNQHEHLLSLWRSHCAMVADRFIGRGEPVDESCLLSEALGDLHAELLEGFCKWQARVYEELRWPVSTDDCKEREVKLGGVDWLRISAALKDEKATTFGVQLAEIVTYLSVWGEAGNLRFMPEMLYFVTEILLTSDSPVNRERRVGGLQSDYSSGRFLANIIRPIYKAVFDEWYESVEVAPSGKDVKKIHAGFENFLPADVANYDDWNELFCDHQRLIEQLQLHDGTPLFALAPGERYEALAHINWHKSLCALQSKTHREIHSLWGVFAATDRIWLLHGVLFFVSICAMVNDPPMWQADLEWNIFGLQRFASVGLIVPAHSLTYVMARWQMTGLAFRNAYILRLCTRKGLCQGTISILPIFSYGLLRILAATANQEAVLLNVCMCMHCIISCAGIFLWLVFPSSQDNLWPLTRTTFCTRWLRYFFWLVLLSVKFILGSVSIVAMHSAIKELKITEPGFASPVDFMETVGSVGCTLNMMMWMVLWLTSFLLYIVDTQLWFVLGCTALGVSTALLRRRFRCVQFALEDAVAKIPERFSEKVLWYSPLQGGTFSPCFVPVWDRIVEYLRYEDNITDELLGNLSFSTENTHCANITWENLTRPLGEDPSPLDEAGKLRTETLKLCKSGCGCLRQPGLDKSGKPHDTCCQKCALHPGKNEHDKTCLGNPRGSSGEMETSRSSRRRKDVKRNKTLAEIVAEDEKDISKQRPDIFRERSPCDIFWKHYLGFPDPQRPKTPDAQWRIVALARSLGLPMPRPFQAPYFPGLTVLIPHYGETIIARKEDLIQQEAEVVPLMDWIKDNWTEEFASFTSRMQATRVAAGEGGWRMAGTQWGEYTDAQWDKLCSWSSMRMQTLWRTVAGMCLYHHALQCHYEAQGEYKSVELAHPSVWDPSDCFTCLVSMQMYKSFSESQLEHTNRMLSKFPACLKIAFIDSTEKGSMADLDGVHPRQERRYFSCVIDNECRKRVVEPGSETSGGREPKFRVELPGYPILGDGKSDNQNHAMPFTRGTFVQCIDANQGAYFEHVLLLPCVLGEFRSHARGDPRSKQIIGLPEHITSNIGSVGDMAASAEHAFGTILQRSYAVLGARMHYGHPDIMNKSYMMQQGGVSKATKTLNLSEDIFAGMDFTLRGDGRGIRHCEYFHLAKGRDLGFNTVLAFFSKLSSGCGEQILTRQMFRLSKTFQFPEFLSFYYGHMGYYLNQFLVSWSCPLLVFCWLLVLVSDCDGTLHAFQPCAMSSEDGLIMVAEIMAKMLSRWFSWLIMLFIVATSLPFLIELWMEQTLKIAMTRLLKQVFTLSPLLFIFQSKVIGTYVVNELRNGGATYVSTGRGLPTERRAFFGEAESNGWFRIPKMTKVGGLYLDYATIAYYDGAVLFVGCVLVLMAGGVSEAGAHTSALTWTWVSLGLVVSSWLYAPFLFNPYQLVGKYFCYDLRSGLAFFVENGGEHWISWYESKQLKRHSQHGSIFSFSSFLTCFVWLAWYSIVSFKTNSFTIIYAVSDSVIQLLVLVPPIAGSVLASLSVAILGICCQCIPRVSRNHDLPRTSQNASAHAAKETCCSCRLPLVLLAALLPTLDLIETFLALQEFRAAGWSKAFIAGVVLKFIAVQVCINLGERGLRSQSFNRFTRSRRALEIWVYSHRMSRDILTSSLILIVLLPLVLLNALNESFCHSCNVHQLIIYRSIGQQRRKDVLIYRWINDAKKTFEKSEGRSLHGSESATSLSDEENDASPKSYV